MTCTIQKAGAIELYFYGELPPDERPSVQAHLKHCAECRHALEDLAIIRAALAARPDVAAPPAGDWSGFMSRLDASIRTAAPERQTGARASGSGRVVMMPLRRLSPYLAMAALLALVALSVLLVWRQRETPSPVGGATTNASDRPAPRLVPQAARTLDPALVSLSGQHFERSKLVLLGLATKDATRHGDDDWAYERNLATTLLSDTRLYRLAAEERGMNTLAGVMRDLELVLLQTSMSQQPDPASLEQLQRLIRRRDLLTKMNVVSTGGP